MSNLEEMVEKGDIKLSMNDYFHNMLRILYGKKPIDYNVISRENRLVNSYIIGYD